MRLQFLARICLAALMMLLIGVAAAQGRRLNTKRPGRLVPERVADDAASIAPDTIVSDSLIALVRLSGYDKPLRSRKESLFVTNGSSMTLHSLTLMLDYLDSKERQLHRRSVEVEVQVPPGETRRVEFRSWDTQLAFYYHLSAKPQRAAATPYDIRCRIIGAAAGRDTIVVSSSEDYLK